MESFVLNNEKFEQIKKFNEVIKDVENTSGRTIKNFILLRFAYFTISNEELENQELDYMEKYKVIFLLEKKFSRGEKKSYIKAVYEEFYDESVNYTEEHIDLNNEEVKELIEQYNYFYL